MRSSPGVRLSDGLQSSLVRQLVDLLVSLQVLPLPLKGAPVGVTDSHDGKYGAIRSGAPLTTG